MTYPDVRFVANSNDAAATLFDFNDVEASPPRQVDADDFSFGAPSVEGDVDAIDPMYGDRQIEFSMSIQGTKPEVAAVLSALARRLLAGPTWLRYQQHEASDILFFRVLRAQPGAVSMDRVWTVDADNREWWTVGLSLPCEPFARGEWVTHPVQTVNNDPAHATNPCNIVLPAIQGDAPVPLRITVNPSSSSEMPGYRWMLALHGGDTSRRPVVWQIGAGDGWTAGADTGASVTASGYSGGSYRQVSFATNAALATRLSGPAPTALVPGRYKVLVRTDRTDSSSVFSLQFSTFGQGSRSAVVTARKATTAASHATWVDLGDFALPPFSPPKGEDPGTSFAPIITLEVGRVSGSGSLRLDAFMLVPLETANTASSSVLFTEMPVFGIEPGAGLGVWDGDLDAFWGYNASGLSAAIETRKEGVFPKATPGVQNVLTVLQQVNALRPFFGEDASDSIAASSVVTVAYQPLFLYLGDS